jgi:hypothetical protein
MITPRSIRPTLRRTAIPFAFLGMLVVGLVAPISALASGPSVEPSTNSFTSTAAGGMTWSTSGEKVACSSTGNGEGSWTTSSTGTAVLRFKGCAGSGFSCTSAGQPTGTIVTSTLAISPVYLDAAHSKFGLLLKSPGSGIFAQFKCGGIINHEWTGSLIGQVTSPGLNTWAWQNTLSFVELALGQQQYTQVEETGPAYRLTQSGTPLAVSSLETLTYAKQMKYAS